MMKTIYASLVVAAVFFMTTRTAHATYGGSNNQQSEAREWTDTTCSYQNNCYGMCGPGCSVYFGSKTLTACTNHDHCIKDNMCLGKSAATAHLNCLNGTTNCGSYSSGACGSLVGAAKALISTHWNNSIHQVKSNIISTWSSLF